MLYKNYFLFVALLTLMLESCIQDVKSPNMVLILADDMAYSDLGCAGSEIKTPNLDKLANNGVLCTVATILHGAVQHVPVCLQADSHVLY